MALLDIQPQDSKDSSTKKLSQLKLFVSMFRDYFSKKYTEMSVWTLLSLGFGLLYLISPIDLIPDISIPLVGFIDDAFILGFVWRQVGKELKRYEAWLANQK